MNARNALILLFAAILVAMLAVTSWASLTQPLWEWRGLADRPNHAWTIATLFDAYFGFVTFYAWVYYKESWPGRIGWFAFVMTFGSIAMASYVLLQLFRLRPDDPLEWLLLRRALAPAPPHDQRLPP